MSQSESDDPVYLMPTFLPIIWIFTEDEGDGIESRIPFIIFSILQICQKLKLATPQYAMYSVQASSALVAEQKTGGPRANHSKFSWLEWPKATQLST